MLSNLSSLHVMPGDECYPENLVGIPDEPSGLFVRGTLEPGDRLAVAVVGTRNPTDIGKLLACEISRDLAGAGVTVVSGLARGIDAIAHKAALETGGRTIACLGCGVDVVYPKENESLFIDIPKSGALISEYPDGTAPKRYHFPARNRIISGVSLGLVLVEAGEKSGALITARCAQDQGRPVMVVPGSPKSVRSAGSNKLIQEGAYLVTSAGDVLSFLRRETEYIPVPEALVKDSGVRQVSLEESLVLGEIEGNPLSADAIADRVRGIGPGRLAAMLSSLEMDGLVVRLAGGKYLGSAGQVTVGKERG